MVFFWIWASSVETGGDCAWTIGEQNINVRGRTCFHIPRSCITGPHSAGSNRSLARSACGIDARRVVVGNQSNGRIVASDRLQWRTPRCEPCRRQVCANRLLTSDPYLRHTLRCLAVVLQRTHVRQELTVGPSLGEFVDQQLH